MTGLEPITTRPETIGDRVYTAIRSAVVSRQITPGERVTEAGLADLLSVSKTPVREALLRLRHIGLLQDNEDGRLTVVSPSAYMIREAYEVRIALESDAVALATERAGDDGLKHIAELGDRSLEAARDNDIAGFKHFDREFHLEMAQSSNNQRLRHAVEDSIDLVSTLRSRDVPDAHASTTCAEQHLVIATAMQKRSPDEAAVALRKHLETVQQLVLAGFSALASE